MSNKNKNFTFWVEYDKIDKEIVQTVAQTYK